MIIIYLYYIIIIIIIIFIIIIIIKVDLDYFTNLLEGSDQYRKFDLVKEIEDISSVLGFEIIAKYENLSDKEISFSTPMKFLERYR